MVEAIVKGRIRLSTILQQAKEGKDGVSVENFAEAIRHAHAQGIEEQRKAGLKKLKAWRTFYADHHPDMAEDYDHLVTQHCHEEEWYPEDYTDDDRIQSWVDPFQEDRHIDEYTLEEYQRLKAEGSEKGELSLVLPHQDPVYRRFEQLRQHRIQIKKRFEEAWS